MVENPDPKAALPFGALQEGLLSVARDRVRDARYVMRRLAAGQDVKGRTGGNDRRPGTPRDILREFARLSDTAITQAEAIVVSLAPPPMRPYGMDGSSFDPQLHFRRSAQGAAFFRRDVYRLERSILARLGVANPLIHESRLGDVHHALERTAAALLPALYAGDAAAACRFGARLALELVRREPVVFVAGLAGNRDRGRSDAEITRFSYAIVGLAAAVAWMTNETDGLLEGATTAALARRENLAAALSSDDAEERLAELYGRLAPHLP